MNIRRLSICLFVCWQGLAWPSYGAEVGVKQWGPFTHRSTPGGIAILPTGVTAAEAKPQVRWFDKPVAVVSVGAEWHALLGIGLSVQPGINAIQVMTKKRQYSVSFTIEAHEYQEQRITLSSNRKVNPPAMDMERINAESQKLKRVKQLRSENLVATDFIWPVKGRISSTFGLRRFFNEQPRNPHGGIDIAVPTGTPIVAPANGTIVDTGDYFFNGKSIFIEHGLGIQTFYAHLDSITVDPGDIVQQGDLIGTVGATGRVTGAHLHWSVGLNGTWIDPMLVVNP
jgi:murein DD-endopeptidase MepM/ murein hydrolase activator NlpD